MMKNLFALLLLSFYSIIFAQTDYFYTKKKRDLTVYKKEGSQLIKWELDHIYEKIDNLYHYSADTFDLDSINVQKLHIQTKIRPDSLNYLLNKAYWTDLHYKMYDEFDFYSGFNFYEDAFEFDASIHSRVAHIDFIPFADSSVLVKRQKVLESTSLIPVYYNYLNQASTLSTDTLIAFYNELKEKGIGDFKRFHEISH